jgi:excisionase family DNA binding protein
MTLLTITEVADRLNVKPSTLYAWVGTGQIPHLKLGRLLRFDRDEINAWLQERRRNAPLPRVSHRRRNRRDHVDDLIAQAKREVYTPCRGKPDQDRATRKGDGNGSV